MVERGTVVPGTGTEFIDETASRQSLLERLTHEVLSTRLGLLSVVALCVLPLLSYIFVDLPPRPQIVLSIVLVAAGLTITAKAPKARLVVVFISLAASLRYIAYRGAETMAFQDLGDTIVSVMLYGAEIYALITMIGGYFQTAIVRRNRPLPLDLTAPELPSVDVFIPTYNEEIPVLRPTILGALSMDYHNKKVWVLDDGCRPEVEDLCRRVGAHYIGREDSFGAKAGNINNALPQTDGALIAFFDADHVPVRGFLKATVGFFLENDRLSLVQTPHHFYNADPFVRNLHMGSVIPPEQHLFYHGIQLGNDFWNSAFFCGSCAVIRRQALEEVGGVSHETVTEDAHTALQMHANGWDSLFLDIPLAAGLATETYAAHIGQRIRWARGMAQIVRLDNPLFKPGLSLAQRVNYFNAAWHFFFGLPRMIFIITPALYLLFDLHPLDADAREVLVYAIPHLVLVGLSSVTVNRNVRHSLWPEVYELAIAPYTALVTTMALFAPRRGKFNVTEKGEVVDKTTFDIRHAMPLLIMMLVLLAAMAITPLKMASQPLDLFTIGVAALWNGYNMVVLGAAVLAAVERAQRRRTHRLERTFKVVVTPSPCADGTEPSFEPQEGEALDVSQGGVRFRIPGHVDLPTNFTTTIISNFNNKVEVQVHARAIIPMDGTTELRCEFVDPDDATQNDLARVLFSDSDNWVGDRFRYDTWFGSLASLLVAMGATLFRRPQWIAAFNDWRDAEEAPLIPGSEDEVCDNCGAKVVEGSTECERCEAPIWGHDLMAARPVPSPTPLAGTRPIVLPIILTVLASLLAAGWAPVVELFSAYMPLQQWERVSYKTRQGELYQAHVDIVAHGGKLKAAIDSGQPVPALWLDELYRIQRDYSLYAGAERRPEVQKAHELLSTVVVALVDTASLYRAGTDVSVLQQRISDVQLQLDAAARAMGKRNESMGRSR